jgi:Protein kinase domain
MASKAGAALCGLIALGGGLLAAFAPKPPATPRVEPSVIAAELDGRLREVAAGVRGRATTLAELPRLAAAVSTDATTVRDLTQDELAFRPKPGETIAIAQVFKNGQPPSVLLVLPDGAAPPRALERTGARLEIAGGKLLVVEVVAVKPRDRADELTGALAVSWLVDVTPVAQRLDAANAAARVEADGQTLALGARPIAPAESLAPLTLTSDAGKTARVVAAIPNDTAGGSPLRPVGAGVAALALAVGGLLLRPGRRPPTLVPQADPARAATSPSAPSNAGAGDIRVGSVIQETYEITRLLGRGGMGAVWQARHLRLPDKKVAIKVLLGEDIKEELFTRFRREAEVTSKLGHPNIVGVLDFNTLPSGAPYLVLEFLEGESLAARLDRGAIPLAEALVIARQIGSALHAAHRANVIHRDLKPDNVFLVPTEGDAGTMTVQAKVLDFGISKIRGTLTMQTRESAMLGTPQYMSPEQANGKNSEIDARSDVWALGAIVYEMLTGKRAFEGESLTTVVVQIIFHPSPSLRDVPGIPPHVAAAVDRALAKTPAERFADIRGFVEALTGGSASQTLA